MLVVELVEVVVVAGAVVPVIEVVVVAGAVVPVVEVVVVAGAVVPVIEVVVVAGAVVSVVVVVDPAVVLVVVVVVGPASAALASPPVSPRARSHRADWLYMISPARCLSRVRVRPSTTSKLHAVSDGGVEGVASRARGLSRSPSAAASLCAHAVSTKENRAREERSSPTPSGPPGGRRRRKSPGRREVGAGKRAGRRRDDSGARQPGEREGPSQLADPAADNAWRQRRRSS